MFEQISFPEKVEEKSHDGIVTCNTRSYLEIATIWTELRGEERGTEKERDKVCM